MLHSDSRSSFPILLKTGIVCQFFIKTGYREKKSIFGIWYNKIALVQVY